MKILKKLSVLMLLILVFMGVTFASGVEKRSINIAILGYGTVGSGVDEVINNNSENVERRTGKQVKV